MLCPEERIGTESLDETNGRNSSFQHFDHVLESYCKNPFVIGGESTVKP